MSAGNTLRNKTQIHAVKEVYLGSIFSFVTEDVTLPNGSRTEMAMVRHPGSTAVVPIIDKGTLLMERQYRHAVGEYLLEIPAGTMEVGESPLICAQRELEEETGYTAREFVKLGKIHIIPAYSDEIIHLYLAKGLIPSRQNLDKDEIIEVVKYSFEETIKMIDEGRITDALTILAIQKAWFYVQSK